MNKTKLFLIHYAGGSCYSYQFLRPFLNEFDFIPLEIPGRGKRIDEDNLETIVEATKDLFVQIKANIGRDTKHMIYGHSMGASLAFRVSLMLENNGYTPSYLIVSGNPGPGVRDPNKLKRSTLDDKNLVRELEQLGGIPEELLNNEELLSFFLPIIRADLRLIEESWRDDDFKKINCPIYALMGEEEELRNEIENWSKFTSSYFKCKIFKGNHFFILEHVKPLVKIFNDCKQAIDLKA